MERFILFSVSKANSQTKNFPLPAKKGRLTKIIPTLLGRNFYLVIFTSEVIIPLF